MISYYLRGIFSRDFFSLILRRRRNSRRRRALDRLFQLPPMPVPTLAAGGVAVHLLVSHDMWREALWAIRSLFLHLDARLPVVVHDGGGLTSKHREAMTRAFPGLQLLGRSEADSLAAAALRDRPECLLARRESLMAVKLIDPWLVAPPHDILLIDSDVLCFAPPAELSAWIAGPRTVNLWNEDCGDAYSVSADGVERVFGVKLLPRINCGLGAVNRASIDWDALEAFLAFERPTRHPWLIEQSAYAFLSSRFGGRLLPRTYAVGTPQGDPPPAKLVTKHYVGKIRDDFYEEGVPFVWEQFQ